MRGPGFGADGLPFVRGDGAGDMAEDVGEAGVEVDAPQGAALRLKAGGSKVAALIGPDRAGSHLSNKA